MKLSTKGRYAVRAMVDLALHTDEGPVPREDIASRQEISRLYLAQLFAKLSKAGLIQSVKGPRGGYVLARGGDEICIGDIIRAVDEPLDPVFCVNAPPEASCPRMERCVTHKLWQRLGQRIAEVLDGVTLEELCAQARELTPSADADERGVE